MICGSLPTGGTAAFVTAERLLSFDVNNSFDIYEWRSGRLHLITDGVSSFASGFSAPRLVGIDADGGEIAFELAQPGGVADRL